MLGLESWCTQVVEGDTTALTHPAVWSSDGSSFNINNKHEAN